MTKADHYARHWQATRFGKKGTRPWYTLQQGPVKRPVPNFKRPAVRRPSRSIAAFQMNLGQEGKRGMDSANLWCSGCSTLGPGFFLRPRGSPTHLAWLGNPPPGDPQIG
eukprot:EG_transcript_50229